MSDFPRPAGPDTAIRNYPRLLRRLLRLMEISRTLGSTLDLPQLLRTIIDAATEMCNTEAASILLIDPRTGELRFEASNSVDTASMDNIVIPREGSIAGWIATHAEPLVINDVTRDPRHFAQVDSKIAFVTRSILGVPLISRSQTIGVLEAINRRTEDEFTADDVEVLQTLGAQAAVAIETARLFQQSDLISEMVHELRMPLAALTAATHLLIRPEILAERREELARTIQQEANRLTSMTTDFLDLAKLESGRMRFTKSPFDLTQLITDTVGVVTPQAAARGIGIRTEVASGLPRLEADQAKIKQVLLNLLTNAIKYNREQGAITVRAEVEPPCVRVSVSDTGRGIPPDALPHIFEKFYRVPDAEGWSQGTGLGLAIARKLVESHGGKMFVASTVGIGTTFTVILPWLVERN